MEKQHFKCILLVLASDNTPLYRYFKKAYAAYISSHPQVKVLFTYGKGVSFQPQEYDLVFEDVPESYITPCMALKTVKAFQYIEQNFTYDYIIRTNLSTFWVLDRLVGCVDRLPKTNCIAGRLGIWGPDYVVGTAMFITSDLIPSIIRDVDTALYPSPKYIPEDKMISNYFSGVCRADIVQLNVVEYIEKLQTPDRFEPSNAVAFRTKNLANRELIDTAVVRQLCQKFYEVDIGVYHGNV